MPFFDFFLIFLEMLKCKEFILVWMRLISTTYKILRNNLQDSAVFLIDVSLIIHQILPYHSNRPVSR